MLLHSTFFSKDVLLVIVVSLQNLLSRLICMSTGITLSGSCHMNVADSSCFAIIYNKQEHNKNKSKVDFYSPILGLKLHDSSHNVASTVTAQLLFVFTVRSTKQTCKLYNFMFIFIPSNLSINVAKALYFWITLLFVDC